VSGFVTRLRGRDPDVPKAGTCSLRVAVVFLFVFVIFIFSAIAVVFLFVFFLVWLLSNEHIGSSHRAISRV
jgi:hypothetical protein